MIDLGDGNPLTSGLNRAGDADPQILRSLSLIDQFCAEICHALRRSVDHLYINSVAGFTFDKGLVREKLVEKDYYNSPFIFKSIA